MKMANNKLFDHYRKDATTRHRRTDAIALAGETIGAIADPVDRPHQGRGNARNWSRSRSRARPMSKPSWINGCKARTGSASPPMPAALGRSRSKTVHPHRCQAKELGWEELPSKSSGTSAWQGEKDAERRAANIGSLKPVHHRHRRFAVGPCGETALGRSAAALGSREKIQVEDICPASTGADAWRHFGGPDLRGVSSAPGGG